MAARQNAYSPNLGRRNYMEQQSLVNPGEGPMWSSSPMPHLFPHSMVTRLTNHQGQNVDIYENPSEHYSSIEPQYLPTIQPSHTRTPYAGLKPRYYMESNNGPQLKVGYGKKASNS